MEEVDNNSSSLQDGEKSEKPKFRFSPDAAPFVPKNFHAVNTAGSDTKISTLSVEAREFYPRNYIHQSESTARNVLAEVRCAIGQLTSKPADFDAVMFSLLAVLNDRLHDGSVIEAVVEDLFAQAVSEMNFRYTGARMCGYLSSRLQSNNALRFQDCLITRCQNELSYLETALSVSNLPHLIGFALYLAELLVNMKDVRSSEPHISELAQLVAHLMSILLNFRSIDSVRTIIQILKLSGPVLEKTVPVMDGLCTQIHNIACDPLTPQHLSIMLSNALALRSTNWGRNAGDSPAVATSYSASVSDDSFLFDDNALCMEFDFLSSLTDSDEALSPESTRMEYWAGDDIMDEETAAAFELFMAESQRAKLSSSKTVLPNCYSEVTSGHP